MSRCTTPWLWAYARASTTSIEDPYGVLDGQLPPAQPIPQRFSFHERHDVVGATVIAGPLFDIRVEQGQDVRVLQPGGDLDLPEEPVAADGGGELRPQHLYRDFAVVLEVLGQIDRGHAPAAELALQRVAGGQCRLQAFKVVGHVIVEWGIVRVRG